MDFRSRSGLSCAIPASLTGREYEASGLARLIIDNRSLILLPCTLCLMLFRPCLLGLMGVVVQQQLEGQSFPYQSEQVMGKYFLLVRKENDGLAGQLVGASFLCKVSTGNLGVSALYRARLFQNSFLSLMLLSFVYFTFSLGGIMVI